MTGREELITRTQPERLHSRREQAQHPRRQRGHHGARRLELLRRWEDGGDEGAGELRVMKSATRTYEPPEFTDIWTKLAERYVYEDPARSPSQHSLTQVMHVDRPERITGTRRAVRGEV